MFIVDDQDAAFFLIEEAYVDFVVVTWLNLLSGILILNGAIIRFLLKRERAAGNRFQKITGGVFRVVAFDGVFLHFIDIWLPVEEKRVTIDQIFFILLHLFGAFLRLQLESKNEG